MRSLRLGDLSQGRKGNSVLDTRSQMARRIAEFSDTVCTAMHRFAILVKNLDYYLPLMDASICFWTFSRLKDPAD
jgi:hypothetical protein